MAVDEYFVAGRFEDAVVDDEGSGLDQGLHGCDAALVIPGPRGAVRRRQHQNDNQQCKPRVSALLRAAPGARAR
jgi:hypothetical protein